MRRSVAVITVTLAVLVIGMVVRTGAFAQGAPVRQPPATAPADILPALLTEVRGLRAAMEQMASAGPRVQLALGRVQLQEQRINSLIRRLEDVRASVLETQSEYDRLQDQSRRLESALRNPGPGGPPPEQSRELREQIVRSLAPVTAKLHRVTAEEAAMAADLANEQARWTDLNRRMEALEAALGPG